MPSMKLALLVSDLAASRRFYTGLGFRVLARADDALTVGLADSVLELRSDAVAARGPHYFTPELDRWPRGTGVEVTIETDDVDAAWNAARAADADVVTPLADGSFRLSDPDGYFVHFRADENGARVAASAVSRRSKGA
jgi:catechol 2,3-dioxygenase-like lactoylglutathione lyase family enzyme